MSRNNRDFGDELGGCLGYLIWVATFGLGAVIFRGLQTPPEIELRRLESPVYWNVAIKPVTCATCQTANEIGQTICFVCGDKLPEFSDLAMSNRTVKHTPSLGTIFAIILVIFIISLCIFLASGAL